jgi:hypothetical protein
MYLSRSCYKQMRILLLLIVAVHGLECDIDILEEVNKNTIEIYGRMNRAFLLLNQEQMSIEEFNNTYHDYDVTHGDRNDLKEGYGGSQKAKMRDIYDKKTQAFVYRTDLPVPDFIPSFQYQVLSIGGPRSGIGFHNHRQAYFSLLYGTKEWFFFGGNREEYIMQEYKREKKWLRDDVSHEWFDAPIYCLQPAGSMIFVPRNWIHATVNPGTAIGIGYQQDSLREKPPTKEAL